LQKAEAISETVLGTKQLIAPEIYQEGAEEYEGEPYGFEVDMWAFGVMFYFMMNMEFHFSSSAVIQSSTPSGVSRTSAINS
jgi:serine/threonine protein kinase